MKWSWKLCRVAGIEVRVHATFAILLAWIAAALYSEKRSPEAAIGGVLFVLAVFGIVVLHELGHALCARRFGIRTRDITLLPIGGVARLERMPENPWHELLVALAGPAVNVVLAALLLLASLVFAPARLLEAGPALTTGSVVVRLLWINVALAAFNMIPAFPMDGGRALRALLATRMPGVRATSIAARLGQGIALLFGAVGLFSNPLLVFIALFVWMGATQEESASRARDAIQGLPVEAAMITDVRTVSPGDRLHDAVTLVLAGFQQDFPVVDGGRVVGVLTSGAILRALSERGADATVESAMERRFVTADPSEELAQACQRLRECECRTLPVLRAGRLVGVLTMDNVGELVLVRNALRQASVRPAV